MKHRVDKTSFDELTATKQKRRKKKKAAKFGQRKYGWHRHERGVKQHPTPNHDKTDLQSST